MIYNVRSTACAGAGHSILEAASRGDDLGVPNGSVTDTLNRKSSQ
jgi:hypothetical protein